MAEQGMRSISDKVFNHVARDNPIVVEEDHEIQSILSYCVQQKDLHIVNYLVIDENGQEQEQEDFPIEDYKTKKIIGLSFGKKGEELKRFRFKFCRNHNFEALNYHGMPEYDTVQINYASPASYDFFVKGYTNDTTGETKPGYWKQVIGNDIDLGFTGLRFDIAYKIPTPWLSELIQYAHDRQPEIMTIAETLAGVDDIGAKELIPKLAEAKILVDGVERPAIDHAMLSTYWAGPLDGWLIDESRLMAGISRYGGAGSPDNHDTQGTVAQNIAKMLEHYAPEDKERAIADICVRDYALAALVGNAHYAQMGYEVCADQAGVFEEDTNPKQWRMLLAEREASDHPLNISERLWEINKFKASLNADNAIFQLESTAPLSEGSNLVKMVISLTDQETKQHMGTLDLFINNKPECGPVELPNENTAFILTNRGGPKNSDSELSYDL